MEIVLAIVTLSFLEIILGVDNIIFVSIVSNKLPENQKKTGRNLGLIFALVFRLLLLLVITWIIKLDQHPAFTIFGISPTVKDLILAVGGLFLLGKSVSEIHHKLEGMANKETGKTAGFWAAIVQICFINLVFSFDSILTAIGMTDIVWVMMVSVIISVGVMIIFGTKISNFISKHPTLEMLALAFLILVGFMLIIEGIVFVEGKHVHVPKGYIYFAVFFALVVEFLNMKLRKKHAPVKLNKNIE